MQSMRNMCLLFYLQSAAGGDQGGLLRHGQLQHTVAVLGFDLVYLDGGHVKASGVRTVVTLTLYVVLLALLGLFLSLLVVLAVVAVLGGDSQNVVFNVQLDVLLLEAGQLGLQLVAVAGVDNVGTEAAHYGAAAENAALKLFKVTERIISGNTISSAFKRNQFKHNIYTSIFY